MTSIKRLVSMALAFVLAGLSAGHTYAQCPTLSESSMKQALTWSGTVSYTHLTLPTNREV